MNYVILTGFLNLKMVIKYLVIHQMWSAEIWPLSNFDKTFIDAMT